ncbi:hypothetical protein RRG08_047813 [Elysia crispata]|uniref:Uncharacterized protein n=1 Tax=Elysia crispata TaxID=231223 RepID=A0AAE0Y3U8_9GAST|nr:hypothetical protein RRG08_047813 [Elysia crispata]
MTKVTSFKSNTVDISPSFFPSTFPALPLLMAAWRDPARHSYAIGLIIGQIDTKLPAIETVTSLPLPRVKRLPNSNIRPTGRGNDKVRN